MSLISLSINNKTVELPNKNKMIILQNLEISIEEGEMIAIMGASGSGKSTLLHIMGCLDTKYDGEYYYDNQMINSFSKGKMLDFRREQYGFVFQDFLLMEQYSAYENIEIPLKAVGIEGKKRKVIINKLAEQLGIKNILGTQVAFLSGGEKQRCAIARALTTRPKVIFADEPTGALDSNNSKMIMDILRELNETGTTIVIVTHDEKVAKICDKIYVLEDGTWKK